MPTMQEHWQSDPESVRAALERYAVYRTHEFDDETGYCTACGQQDTYAIANAIHCFGSDSLVAISHLRRPPVDELAGADTIWKNPA